MNETAVLIVGSGPTGMTLAIELARLGVSVRIIDKSDHMARWSQALVLQARTLEQLQRYGIAEQAVARGRKVTRAHIWSDGKQLVDADLSRIKSRYPYVLFIPQNETEAILNAHMEALGVKTERGVELLSLVQEADSAHCTLRGPSGVEERLRVPFVVGCDGAHSTVRDAAGIKFEGETIGLSFLLGDLELEGTDVPTDELSVHLHHGDVVFLARLSDRLTRLIVAQHGKQGEDAPKEATIPDFQRALDAAEVKVRVLGSEWMTPFHVNDRQAEHYRVGRAFLAGDASHIHSPVGGQGMNTGMQDAANLGWKLAAVLGGADARLLDSYEEERSAVGRVLLEVTGTGLKLATSANPVLDGVREVFMPIVSGLGFTQDRLAGFISETAISYRDSSIVEERGGGGSLRAGDRMPDASLKGSSLLAGWTDAKPFAVLVEVDEDFALPGVRVARVRSHELGGEAAEALGSDAKVFVVRPDGYIGYRGGPGDVPALAEYLAENGFSRAV